MGQVTLGYEGQLLIFPTKTAQDESFLDFEVIKLKQWL